MPTRAEALHLTGSKGGGVDLLQVPPVIAPSEFLRLLGHGDGLVHLALYVGGRSVSHRFVRAADGAQLQATLDEPLRRNAAQNSALLFGINSRAAARANVPTARAMVFDFDAQKVGKEAMLRFSKRAPLTAPEREGGED